MKLNKLLIIFTLIILVISITGCSTTTSVETTIPNEEIYSFCKTEINKILKEPDTAIYPDISHIDITKMNDNIYHVKFGCTSCYKFYTYQRLMFSVVINGNNKKLEKVDIAVNETTINNDVIEEFELYLKNKQYDYIKDLFNPRYIDEETDNICVFSSDSDIQDFNVLIQKLDLNIYDKEIISTQTTFDEPSLEVKYINPITSEAFFIKFSDGLMNNFRYFKEY